MPRLPRSILAVLLTAVLGLAGCGSDDDAAPTPSTGGGPAAVTVKVDDLKFRPAKVTVEAGDAVAWDFADGAIQHNVKGDFATSPTYATGRWTHTFPKPGRYDYLCSIHPYMKGTVTVR